MHAKQSTPVSTLAKSSKKPESRLVFHSINKSLTSLAESLTQDLALPQLAGIFSQIRETEAVLKDLATNARERVLARIKAEGESSETGTIRLEAEGYRLEARRTRTGLDAKKVEALIRAKGIDPAVYMGTEIRCVLNPNTADLMQASKKFTQAEIETCRPPETYAVQQPSRIEE